MSDTSKREASTRDASTPDSSERDRPLLEIRDLDIAFGSKRKRP